MVLLTEKSVSDALNTFDKTAVSERFCFINHQLPNGSYYLLFFCQLYHSRTGGFAGLASLGSGSRFPLVSLCRHIQLPCYICASNLGTYGKPRTSWQLDLLAIISVNILQVCNEPIRKICKGDRFCFVHSIQNQKLIIRMFISLIYPEQVLLFWRGNRLLRHRL